MCYMKICCFFSLEYGSLLIGIATTLLSIIECIFSIMLLAFEEKTPKETGYYMKVVTHLELTQTSETIILSSSLVIEVIWLFLSVLLIIGLFKNRPGFVLSYFFHGIVVTIVYMLTGLLLLLQSHWAMAIGIFILSNFYLYCLVAVYNTYELMMNGKILTWSRNRSDDEEILNSYSEDNI